MAARSGNVLQRLVQLIWDRVAGRRAESEAKASADRVERSWTGSLKRIAGVVGIAFGARQVLRFATDAIRAATQAKVSWDRLGGTLKTVNVRFEEQEMRIKAAAAAMQQTTNVDGEQFADTLQTLTALSGNFEESLQNVGLVADFAALHNIELGQAADVVGRAMTGNLRALKQFGITAKDSADAIRQMREQSAGLAEATADPIKQLANAWDDLKEAIGERLVTTSAIDGLIDTVTWLTRIVEELDKINKASRDFIAKIPLIGAGARREMEAEQLEFQRRLLTPAPSRTGTRRTVQPDPEDVEDLADAERKRQAALDEEIGLLTKGIELGRRRSDDLQRLMTIGAQETTILLDQNAALQENVRARERLAKINETLNKLFTEQLLLQKQFDIRQAGGTLTPTPRVETTVQQQTGGVLARDLTNADALREWARQVNAAATTARDEFTLTFEVIQSGSQAAAEALGQVAVALLHGSDGAIEALRQLAAAKVLENTARAIESGAMAIFSLATLNPVAAAAAGKAAAGFAAAAAAWGALSGAIGSPGRGATGASTAGGAAQATRANNTTRPPEAINEIHLHGILAELPVRVEDTLARSVANSNRRRGNTRTVIRRDR